MIQAWFVVLIVSVAALLPKASAQSWTTFHHITGPGSETVEHFEISANGYVYYTGLYDQSQFWNGYELPVLGGKDVYIASRNAGGDIQWVISGGSALDDETQGLAIDPEGNLLVCGSFWFSAEFGTWTLEAGQNPKAMFLIKIDPEGHILWGKSIRGSGMKGIGGIRVDASGNIWLGGYFSGGLQLDDTALQAVGTTDLFLIKFSAGGELCHAFREGLSGDTRATALALTPMGEPVIGGYFNATTQVGGATLSANTLDRDVFIASYSALGVPKWAVKAGGVHDEDLTGLSVDIAGNVFASGFFVGVMNLGNGIGIQSATGNPDIFILKYDESGIPLQARALGGQLSQLATGLDVRGGRIALCGFFQGNIALDGFSAASGSNFAGFFALFDEMLTGTWLQAIPATGGAFPSKISIAADGRLWAAGSFGGLGQFPTGFLSSWGLFDGFILGTSVAVPVDKPEEQMGLKIYPNPARNRIFIEGLNPEDQVWLAASNGKLIQGLLTPISIDITHLPNGTYLILLNRKGRQYGFSWIKMD